MRNNLAFPLNEKDLEWFEEGMTPAFGIEILEELERLEEYLCDCGKPIDKRYDPCCSLKCWSKKFE